MMNRPEGHTLAERFRAEERVMSSPDGLALLQPAMTSLIESGFVYDLVRNHFNDLNRNIDCQLKVFHD